MSNKKFGFGLAFGALAGAIAGILTAPKSGKETRKDIKAQAIKLKEVAGDKTSEAIDAAEGVFAETKEKAEKAADETRKVADEVQKRALNTFDGAKKGFNKKI